MPEQELKDKFLVDEVAVKYRRLQELLKNYPALLVAFSGGVDSALLLKVAAAVLGDRVVAATSVSPALPRRELQEARQFAAGIGVPHLLIETEELNDENYRRNPVNRCYFCKHELYGRLLKVARESGIFHIANGTNVDDLGDYRPGLQAAAEFQVVSPLQEAGLGKADVRELARRLGLAVWDKPASPCLASRIPYGSAVTREKLAAVEQAEARVRELGIRELRVRHFGETALVEVREEDLPLLEEHYEELSAALQPLGFLEVRLRQFRSGALNPSSVRRPVATERNRR